MERIRRRNTVLIRPSCLATSGAKTPSATPAAMPMKIQAVNDNFFIALPT